MMSTLSSRAASRWLLACLAVFILSHVPFLNLPPNGFHKWREADTASVAENFKHESWNIFYPRVHSRGPTTGSSSIASSGVASTGVVGMELPIYSYSAALLYQILGFSHIWPRLISLLAGCWILISGFYIAQRLLQQPRFILLALLGSPLLYFYAIKIQPDVLGLALSLHGLRRYGDLLADKGRFFWLKALEIAASLALAALIKPTFLVVGAPMLVLLLEREGRRGVYNWRQWLIAITALAPMLLWLRHANSLQNHSFRQDFSVSISAANIWESVRTKEFFQNVFITWPWELQVGLAALPFFLVGALQFRRLPGRAMIGAWLIGCLAIFVLVAGHCATPHDYYTLPIVMPLALITAHGLAILWNNKRPRVRYFVIALLIAMAAYTPGRIIQRFDFDVPFVATRQLVNQLIPARARVMVIDDTPIVMLYLVGRYGESVAPENIAAGLELAAQEDLHYLLVRDQDLPSLRAAQPVSTNSSRLGQRLFAENGVSAFELLPGK